MLVLSGLWLVPVGVVVVVVVAVAGPSDPGLLVPGLFVVVPGTSVSPSPPSSSVLLYKLTKKIIDCLSINLTRLGTTKLDVAGRAS